MKNLKNKKGISLIVLILTIIVMIILATAIILSLNNSGIIGKANKAKRASDYASLKEYANVLRAEYELMSDAERTGYEDDIAYVNAKLEAEGYKERLNDDGILLKENTIEALEAGIKIGDVVTGYTLDTSDSKKSYITSGNENTAPTGKSSEGTPTAQTVTRIEYTTWKYIGIGENGELLIAPDMVDSVADNQKITLSGKGGYLNGPKELDDMCAAMYSVTGKGTARSMNIDDITRILDYTKPKGGYYSSLESKWKDTDTPLTIQQIIDTKGEPALSHTSTPDDSDIGEYYADYYKISKTSLGKDFVYTSNTYWLASSCVYTDFYYSFIEFSIRCVIPDCVYAWPQISYGASVSSEATFRPTVSLEPDIQLTKVSDGNWSI